MLNNKKCDGGFMLFGFVISKCIGDAEAKNHFTPSGFSTT
jgi:hypothetical protein